jgi:dolichol-phosphate hexosyltransferase
VLPEFRAASESGCQEAPNAQILPQRDPARPTTMNPAELSRRHTAAANHAPLKLSILMPAYNEERTITQAIEELLRAKYPCDVELIVVDDGSTDQTSALLAQVNDARVIVHRHPINRGKGAGLISALSLASGSHILPFDADLEYLPDDIPKMLAPVIKGHCNVVYGVRLFGYNTVYQSYRYAKGNRVLTRLANLLFDARLSDLHTCLKLMPRAMMKSFNLHEAGFGLDTELTASLLRRGERPFEVPVSYYSRSHAQGKKITWRDAAGCAWVLLRVRLRSRSSLTTPMCEAFTSDALGSACPVPQMSDRQETDQASPWLANDDDRDADVTAATA